MQAAYYRTHIVFDSMVSFRISRLLLALILTLSATSVTRGEESCSSARSDSGRPTFLANGEVHSLDEESFKASPNVDGVMIADVPGGESVQLRYVQAFLSVDEVAQAIGYCDGRSGWTVSRQTVDGDGSATRASRTSSSCPLIWPIVYLPRLEALRESGRLTADLEGEIMFAWKIMQRVSDMLEVDVAKIEPLQLIRYEPGQMYKQHHDHGSYYGANSEQRPSTFLLYLSSMPQEDGGGYTKFNELDIAVLPREGDGIIWSNVDKDGNVLNDALHEAVPPNNEGGVRKYAMNVWIAENPIMDNIDTASYRT